jgi:2-methylcitrate dehydratase PrpD
MSDYLDTVCDFLATCRLEDLSEGAVARARRVMADSMAAIAAGSREPEVIALTDRVATVDGPATVIGTGLRTEAGKAAFLNGTAGTFLEMDEGNQYSRGHPGIHAIPAALAYAETHGKSGKDLMLAFVLGYEIGARIGMAAKILPTMHPHGTWGTVGAAVAVAKLAGASAAQFREVINVASTLGLATSRQTMLQGGTVRNSFAGWSGDIGLRAWDMVECGFTGERDGLSHIWGKVVSTEWKPEEMTRELGSRWEIARNYFKRHSCCRYNHGTLDALAMVVEQHGGLSPDEVASVRVETYSLAAELQDRSPTNTLAGKFSVPFAVATTLINGSSGLMSFTLDQVRRADIQAFADKVEVVEDPALTALMPDYRPSRVIVTLTDGTVLSAETKTNRGDTEDPYDDADLDAKYVELCARVWPKSTSDAVYRACFALETLPGASELTDAMQVAPLAQAGE